MPLRSSIAIGKRLGGTDTATPFEEGSRLGLLSEPPQADKKMLAQNTKIKVRLVCNDPLRELYFFMVTTN